MLQKTTEISEYARKAGDAFAELIATVERLRSPGGCPWDAEQTYSSLRQHTLEEMYELLDAVDSGNTTEIEEELGDLLTHVAFYTDIANRSGEFDAVSTSRKVIEKLIRRHPHVFSDEDELTDSSEVLDRWDSLKRKESGRTSVVQSLPAALPALALAGSVQRRAIKAGVAWPKQTDENTLFERRADESDAETEARASELLMRVAREIRQEGIDPEIALHSAAASFRERVLKAESMADGVALEELDPEERARVWRESAQLSD